MNQNFKTIDLTHTITEMIPTWDGDCGFHLPIAVDYKDCTEPDLFRIQKIECKAGIGTHMDAPAHCIVDGRTIEALPLQELVTDCIVVDVSAKANEHYMITSSDVEAFEKAHGEIPAGSLVIFYTGWSKHWETPEKYNNNHVFPSVDVSTAELLLTRGIVGIGIDTLSCDTGAHGFPVHRAILGANKYLIENVANAHLLPPTGAKVAVLPVKIKDATEAPIRLIALL